MRAGSDDDLMHVILAVKGWDPIMTPEFQVELRSRLLRNFHIKKTSVLEIVSGAEHFHVLLKLPSNNSLSEIMGWVKGESSHWFNLEHDQKFHWQKGYYAGSVSEDNINEITHYLDSHSLVHQNLTFGEEILKFRAGNLEEMGYLPD